MTQRASGMSLSSYDRGYHLKRHITASICNVTTHSATVSRRHSAHWHMSFLLYSIMSFAMLHTLTKYSCEIRRSWHPRTTRKCLHLLTHAPILPAGSAVRLALTITSASQSYHQNRRFLCECTYEVRKASVRSSLPPL